MDDELDLAIALSLQQRFNNETKKEHSQYGRAQGELEEGSWDPKSIVNTKLELTDPNPNIHHLFVQYDAMFFWHKLVSCGVAVRWSPRMTLCAGVCAYEGRGGLCSIRLSQPLLKLRPRKDLVETLLHEMIHAYLFVTENYRDHDGHGPKFQSHMHRINQMTGTHITIYHNFHNEVGEYRQHWWKCNGPCQSRPPYFGVLKRAMNRAPSPRDPWWSQHQATCGGTYEKIKEPENYGKKKLKQPKEEKKKKKSDNSMDIRGMFKKGDKGDEAKKAGTSSVTVSEVKPFEGEGHKLIDSKKDVSKSKDNDELSLRDKMLQAAEKRQQEAKQSGRLSHYGGVSQQKRPREKDLPSNLVVKKTKNSSKDISNYSSDASTKPSAKKPRLMTDDPVIVIDSPQTATKSLPSSSRSDNIPLIDLSEEAGPSSDVHVREVDRSNRVKNEVISIDDSPVYSEPDEVLRVETVPSSPSLSPDDLRTCPVCGMSNIPKAIINAHTVFCLDAEEESQQVDEDNL